MSLHFADPNLLLVEFSLAVRIHNIAGVTLICAYLFFVVANIVTGNWWQFVPKPPGILKRPDYPGQLVRLRDIPWRSAST